MMEPDESIVCSFETLLEFLLRIHEVVLSNSGEGAHDYNLKYKIGEGHENDEVVEAQLQFCHVGAPPERNPIEEPKQVAKESQK